MTCLPELSMIKAENYLRARKIGRTEACHRRFTFSVLGLCPSRGKGCLFSMSELKLWCTREMSLSSFSSHYES